MHTSEAGYKIGGMQKRLFAALELPVVWQEALGALSRRLQTSLPPRTVRWVKPDGIHLTLKFYGETPAEKLPALQAGLARAAAQSEPLRLLLDQVGMFPDPLRARVIWVGLAGTLAPLAALQKAVEAAAEPLGFKPEERAFTPHLTLGRVSLDRVRPVDRGKFAEALKLTPEAVAAFEPRTLSLMQSDLKVGGAVYTCLFTTPLGSQNA